MKPHVAEADRIQREIIRKMTPSEPITPTGPKNKSKQG
jgi:hypothetical protein